ncbi:hypothetical protein HID58_025429 [Brassica napus]|uniref:NET2A-D/KIP1-like alpha-helical domain-containing protein n=1 Tax=Brassica napus TaxID=3708 RepID=A0ABQ8CL23_BRANA|nr:hypothetical protein HID58_025429 [Brassica napus]
MKSQKREQSSTNQHTRGRRSLACKEKLAELRERQEKSCGEAGEERAKIEESRERLRSMVSRFLGEEIVDDEESGVNNSSLNAREMAERVDEVVNRVISLEGAVSSQSALIEGIHG